MLSLVPVSKDELPIDALGVCASQLHGWGWSLGWPG